VIAVGEQTRDAITGAGLSFDASYSDLQSAEDLQGLSLADGCVHIGGEDLSPAIQNILI
jgi:hypothetical protein